MGGKHVSHNLKQNLLIYVSRPLTGAGCVSMSLMGMDSVCVCLSTSRPVRLPGSFLAYVHLYIFDYHLDMSEHTCWSKKKCTVEKKAALTIIRSARSPATYCKGKGRFCLCLHLAFNGFLPFGIHKWKSYKRITLRTKMHDLRLNLKDNIFYFVKWCWVRIQ